MQTPASRLDELVARLPGTVWRGRAPATPSEARLPTGFGGLDDLLGGGVPRSAMTEVVAAGSAGATTLAHRVCLEVTRGALAAWIDAPDAFDPASAAASGIDLERLLWVRPPDLGVAFVATELVLAMGGFPLVLLDVGEAERVRSPLSSWLRLSRAAAGSRSALLVLHRKRAGRHDEAPLSSWAALRLDLTAAPRWDRGRGAPELLAGLEMCVSIARRRGAGRSTALRIRTGH